MSLFSEKCTEWVHPKWPWHVQGQNTMCMPHTPPGSKFSSVLLYGETFLSYEKNIVKSTLNKPKNDLAIFKVKCTHMHTVYTPETQIFVRLVPRRAVFKLHSCFFFSKLHRMTPNDLGMFKVKSTYVDPRGPKFHQFCSTRSRFWVNPPFRKSPWMTSKWPWKFQGHRYPNCHPFRSTMSRFRRNWDLWIPIGYNAKIKLLITLNELKFKNSKKNIFGDHYQEPVARIWGHWEL